MNHLYQDPLRAKVRRGDGLAEGPQNSPAFGQPEFYL